MPGAAAMTPAHAAAGANGSTATAPSRPGERHYMSWGVRFRIRQYLKGSLWLYPLIGAILGPLVALIVHQADASVTLPAGWQYTPSRATTLFPMGQDGEPG